MCSLLTTSSRKSHWPPKVARSRRPGGPRCPLDRRHCERLRHRPPLLVQRPAAVPTCGTASRGFVRRRPTSAARCGTIPDTDRRLRSTNPPAERVPVRPQDRMPARTGVEPNVENIRLATNAVPPQLAQCAPLAATRRRPACATPPRLLSQKAPGSAGSGRSPSAVAAALAQEHRDRHAPHRWREMHQSGRVASCWRSAPRPRPGPPDTVFDLIESALAEGGRHPSGFCIGWSMLMNHCSVAEK